MKPAVVISMGDPSGIGPEVIVKALSRPDVMAAIHPIIAGDLSVLQKTNSDCATGLNFYHASERMGLRDRADSIPVLESHKPAIGSPGSAFLGVRASSRPQMLHSGRDARAPRMSLGIDSAAQDAVTFGLDATGVPLPANGRAAHAWIVEAVQLTLDGHANALCTAPISKEAMYGAGFTFPGHTELLAELCDMKNVRMMLAGGGLHVVLQTIHTSLGSVPSLLSTSELLTTFRIASSWAAKYLRVQPRIAVCGLNPHAGEGGHFGSEEVEIIRPAIEAARQESMEISGPFPADTIYYHALQGHFEIVIAMYHDQALIPVKTLDFHGGVNITLGLPIIRTSPDHGTAFNLAGKGIANPASMATAIMRAAELSKQ